MDRTTSIDAKDSTILTRDDSIGGLWLYSNKKIQFLPIRVGEKFPNLMGIFAGDCSINEISRENFKGLNKLKHLILRNNQIEMIARDTFNDLTSIERFDLGKKLSFILIFSQNLFDFFRRQQNKVYERNII